MCEKLRKRQKWLSLIWREKVLLYLIVNFIDEKITEEEWNSSWSFFFFFCVFWLQYGKILQTNWDFFFTSSFRSFFFSSLAISAHCSLLDLLINIIWNFIITILKHILHYVQVVGIVSFLNQCYQVSMGLDFSYHVHLQHHQGFLSYNPQISF